ncbi:pyrroline-5-carboxylate reductase [bacterium]|nr:pyrroline-5-carboxylate reductase [bacterium]MBU4561597.1 pyrroline-5-carboxylate reductase [bacterium]MCG2676620.1 pyrroline-5-carboxylate reductase [bacterium]
MLKKRIAFLGVGNMATALMRGIIEAGLTRPEDIVISDINKERLRVTSHELQVIVAKDNREAVKEADVIILAVKPNDMEGLLSEIKESLDSKKLIISIAAGITTSYIEKMLKKEVPVIRIMPNTPVAVKEGASAFSIGEYVSQEEEKIVKSIFGAVGKIVKVEENLMDAVTALSGSGPAYIFYIIASLIEAAISLGLNKKTATILAIQTVLGSAKLLQETGEEPAALKKKVTSKGGTTEAALLVLDEGKLKETLDKALKAAAKRSQELKR